MWMGKGEQKEDTGVWNANNPFLSVGSKSKIRRLIKKKTRVRYDGIFSLFSNRPKKNDYNTCAIDIRTVKTNKTRHT